MEIDSGIMRILHDYFDNDVNKISEWLNTQNPNLGTSPCEMIVAGKQKRLLSWMRQQTDINPRH